MRATVGLIVITLFLSTGLSWAADKSVEERLRELEDREEIRQLLMDYGRFLDARDFVAFARLFAQNDGEWVGGLGSAKGRDGIRKLMEGSIGKSTPTIPPKNFHIFTNDAIRVDGDHATALTKWFFWVSDKANRPQPFYLGHYQDTFVRENGQWCFLRRVVYGDIPTDDPLKRK